MNWAGDGNLVRPVSVRRKCTEEGEKKEKSQAIPGLEEAPWSVSSVRGATEFQSSMKGALYKLNGQALLSLFKTSAILTKRKHTLGREVVRRTGRGQGGSCEVSTLHVTLGSDCRRVPSLLDVSFAL